MSKHLEQHGEGYVEHMLAAFGMGKDYVWLGVLLMVHAVLPGVLSQQCLRLALRLAEEMDERIRRAS